MYHTGDTICALSTPQGTGGLAVVRISGPNAVTVAGQLFSRPLLHAAGHKAMHGWIKDGDHMLDEVVLTLFKAPRSFTGEEVVEISCHGSLYIQQRLLELLVARGCRLAAPGEFSLRAFLHGKMDLSQAEAVADLIASESAAEHHQSMHQLRGGFSKEINELREQLLHFSSLLELELDFAEEDVQFADRTELLKLIEVIIQSIQKLVDSFAYGNALKKGVPVAIVGAPNAGKSTLLNALLNEERAIVSDIPGTTRDTIEDTIYIDGVRFRLIDTAGLRHSEDVVEKLGIERTLDKLRQASLILLVTDGTTSTDESLHSVLSKVREQSNPGTPILLLLNKSDMPHFSFHAKNRDRYLTEAIATSALTGAGLREVQEAMVKYSGMKSLPGETIVINARHAALLRKALESLIAVKQGLQTGVTSDFLAIDVRSTLHYLGETIGRITADDMLNQIFSKFCIGK